MDGKAVLDSLLDQEQSLRGKAKTLKSDLEGLNSEIVSKQSEIEWLLAKVAELKSNKRKCEFSSEENNGESHHKRKRIKLNHERTNEPERLAETILHEEMWREIFSKVDDGLDLLSGSRSCQHFQDILDPLKNNFLFGNVFPFLIPHLNLSGVLKCRLVSKAWRSTTNSFLEEWSKIKILHMPLTISVVHPFGLIIWSITSLYTFATESWKNYGRTVNAFLQRFNPSARSPFIANSIQILHNDTHPIKQSQEKKVEFRKEVDAILDNYGKHIFHFSYWEGISLTGSAGLVASEVLRKLFSKAQKLQTLAVAENYVHVEEDVSEIEDIPDSLPDLESLAIKSHAGNPLTNWLFRNFHLQIIKLNLQFPQGLDTASNFTWLKVTELRCKSPYRYETKDYLKCFGSFPGLKKLYLHLPDFTFPKILRIIQLLPKICPSFYALQLSYDGVYSYPTLDDKELLCDAVLFAPKELDTMEFNFSYKFWDRYNFAFLLRFPHIKKLSITCDPALYRDKEICFVKDDKMEIIEVVKYLKPNSNPFSSNVWRMLPNLETLQLQDKIYKRPKTSHPNNE